MSSSENIVQEYLKLENKSIENIEILANKHDLTTKELISFLRQYNIETPIILSRIDAIDWNESESNAEHVSNEVDLDNNMSVAVSIQKYFYDLGFDKKKGSEGLKILCHYVKTQYGIEPFSLFRIILENLIKNKGIFTLEKVLEAIKNRDLNSSETIIDTKREYILKQINTKMLEMTRNIMLAPEIERKKKIMEGFKIIKDAFDKEYREKIMRGSMVLKKVLG